MVVMMTIMIGLIFTILFPVSLLHWKYMRFASNSKVYFHIEELQEIEK
jgi:hypothetical protein